jgi:hypothetical protein
MPLVIVSQPIINIATFRFPIPVPGLEGMLYFSGANITEFLKRFNELYNKY